MSDLATPSGDLGSRSVGNQLSAASWFPSDIYFNQAIDNAPVDAQSDTILQNLIGRGGWGLGHLQIDFGIDVYYADASSVRLPFSSPGLYMPDSDVPTSVPIDPNSAAGFESGSGKICDGGDCHYLVVDAQNRVLIELDQAQTDGQTFTTVNGGSAAIWSFDKAYPANLRGDVCTSADASGGLMAPLLFTAEEVAAGHIDHAIRFILPNDRIQYMEYVRPATHGTGASTWAMSNGVPYGARFRLKASYDTSGLGPGAQVVAAALKKYGMILSDGGDVAFTAKSDRLSTTKWTIDSHALAAIQPSDFEMVEASYGSDQVSSAHRYDFASYDCHRNP